MTQVADWKYRWNDQEVSKEYYDEMVEKHKQWVIEQENKAQEPEVKEKRKTRGKKK